MSREGLEFGYRVGVRVARGCRGLGLCVSRPLGSDYMEHSSYSPYIAMTSPQERH